MDTFTQQLVNLFIAPPGNLIYYLVLAFSIAAALQAAIMAFRVNGSPPAGRRLLAGLALLLACQVVLFAAGGLAWQGLANPRILLPPLDRAVAALGMLALVWLWAFPRPNRIADALFAVLGLGLIIAFTLSLNLWSAVPLGTGFNAMELDWAWELGIVAVLLVGILLLLVIRPAQWPLGLAMLALNLAGHTAHLVAPAAGDFSGVVRVAQLCSFPLLPALAQRLQPAPVPSAISIKSGQPANQAAKPPAGGFRERRRHSADPRTVFDWLQVSVKQPPEKVYAELVRAFAQTMLADCCLLARAPRNSPVVEILAAYDFVREEFLAPMSIPAEALPVVAGALQKGRSLRLGGEAPSSPELDEFKTRLNYENPGALMLVPLAVPPASWGGFILLSPYSGRAWTADDQTYLLSSIESMVAVLTLAESGASSTPTLPGPAVLAPDLQPRLALLESENQALRANLEGLRASQPPDMDGIVAVQQEAEAMILNLQAENERLRQNGAAREETEVIAALIQELRQPMASISGYTDLLLAESAGILGALQRKFLERVKGSIERMNAILNDLVQIMVLQSGPLEMVPVCVNAGALVDEALTSISSQLREKNISVLVDMPDDLPEVETDRDALGEIVRHLLQNAGAVTPVEGSIGVRLALQTSTEGSPELLLEISDTGGGIDEADLPRVFSRRYRADNPLIQGVGDTGVGLSIAKTLVEAQHGRIWVSSSPGQGTTFSVLLPVRPEQEKAASNTP